MSYWEALVPELLCESGIKATEKQALDLAQSIKWADETQVEATGQHLIPDPLLAETTRLKVELQYERDKVVCDACGGRGYFASSFLGRTVEHTCSQCKGKGMWNPRPMSYYQKEGE